MKLIDKDVLVAEIKERIETYNKGYANGDDKRADALDILLHDLNTLEVKEVDLNKEAELIANGIMIGVQSNKYGTNTYNTERNDFNHYHLKMAARKGIELGLKAQNGGFIWKKLIENS